MRCIRGYVSKKRFLLFHTLANETVALLEKDICTKTLRIYDLSVVEITTIKIGIIPDIGGLPHAPAPMTVYFGKPTVFRTVWEVVSEVPLTKHSGLVSVFLEKLAQCPLIRPQHGTPHNRMPYARTVSPVPRHESRPRW